MLEYTISLAIHEAERARQPVVAGLLLAAYYMVKFIYADGESPPEFESEDVA